MLVLLSNAPPVNFVAGKASGGVSYKNNAHELAVSRPLKPMVFTYWDC